MAFRAAIWKSVGNQLTGFHMIATLDIEGLNPVLLFMNYLNYIDFFTTKISETFVYVMWTIIKIFIVAYVTGN